MDAYKHLQRFLSIAIGKDVEPIRFQMKTGRGRNTRTVTLMTGPKENTAKKSIHPSEMNFTFSDIKKNRQTIFEEWFTKKDKHSDMFDLFSSINSNASKNINNQFKDIVSAIEGYVTVETGMSKTLPEVAVRTLDEYLPESDRLISECDYSRIQITRNKLSHIKLARASEETRVMNDSEKYLSSRRMHFLLEYALLKNLGLEDSLLEKFYKKRKLYL